MANNPGCQFLAVTLLPTCLLFLFPWLPLRRGPVLWQPTTFQPCRGAHASLLIVKTLSRQPLPSPSSAKKTLAKWGKHLHSALLDINHLLHVLLFLDAVDHLIARPRTFHMSEMCTKLRAPKFETTTIWLRNLSISIDDVLNQEWCNPLSVAVHPRQGHSGKWKRKREKERERRFLGFSFANLQISNFQNSSITNCGCKRKSQHRHRERESLTLYLKLLQFFTCRYFWAWNIFKLDQVYYAWLIKWGVKRTKIQLDHLDQLCITRWLIIKRYQLVLGDTGSV